MSVRGVEISRRFSLVYAALDSAKMAQNQFFVKHLQPRNIQLGKKITEYFKIQIKEVKSPYFA